MEQFDEKRWFTDAAIRDDETRLAALKLRFTSDHKWLLFLSRSFPVMSETHQQAIIAELCPANREANVRMAKPLLILFLCGAHRCCRFLFTTTQHEDLVTIREHEGNLFHALVIGCSAKLRPYQVYDALLEYLIHILSEEQLFRLNAEVGHLSLRPAELAVRLDQFRLAECLFINGGLPLLGTEVCGPHIFATFSVGFYDPAAVHSRFLVSPLSLLVEDNSVARINAMKEAGIFRPDSLFCAWSREYCRRGPTATYFVIVASLVILVMMLLSGFRYSQSHLFLSCKKNFESVSSVYMYFEFIIMVLGSCISSFAFINTCVVCANLWKMKERLNYRPRIRFISLYWVSIHYCLPSILFLIAQFSWLIILSCPSLFCSEKGFVFHTFVTSVMLLSFLYFALYAAQVEHFVGHFVSKFFTIFSQFFIFFVFYFCVVSIFARIFENVFRSVQVFRNETIEKKESFLFKDYGESWITVFRISLGIMDESREATSGFMMFVHVIYVLILSFMFFNYIIGDVSAQLSVLKEIQQETDVMHQIVVCQWLDLLAHPIQLNFFSWKSTKTRFTVCLPMTAGKQFPREMLLPDKRN